MLAHRIIWSAVFTVILLLLLKRRGWMQCFREPESLKTLALSSFLICTNWLVYIWAVSSGRVLDASLGQYITPLLVLALASLVFKEKINRPQIIAVTLALVGVVLLGIQYGRIPWVALLLASSFSVYAVIKKRSRFKALQALGIECILATPLALLWLVHLHRGNELQIFSQGHGYTLLTISTGVITAIPLLLFATGAKDISMTAIGFVQFLAPSLSFVSGYFI